MIKSSMFTGPVLCALVMSVPQQAAAHVKWFAPYDLGKPPLPVGEVFTSRFLYLYLVSIVCVYAFFWIDRYLYRTDFMAGVAERLTITRNQSLRILRIAAGIFFAALFIYGMQGKGFLLTPELRTSSPLIPWMQAVMAGCALCAVTAPLMGVGILILYAIGVTTYGIFHMLDYMIFFGIGVYLLLSRMQGDQWVTGRYVTLFATTALTLMWAAIEKWGYPYWTYPLLKSDPGLLMGMTPEFYMLFAGFVEFNITFMLISSASIFSRITALGLNMIFILAIYKFGMVDFVGHLLIIAILLILVLRGPTSARYFLVLSNKTLWTEAYFMTGLYILAFNIVFIAYYGIYHLTY